MRRHSARCEVQCEKCAWKSKRRLQILGSRGRIEGTTLVGQESYRHLKCAGRVVITRVLGSHVMQ